MKKIFVSAFLIVTFWACEKDNPVRETLPPEFAGISKSTSYVGDTLNISGQGFGSVSPENYLVLDTNVKIRSSECFRWHDGEITVIIPAEAVSGYLRLFVSDSLIDSAFIEIARIAPLETVEVAPGEFEMGSSTGSPDEQPVHLVEITDSLVVGKYEITQQVFSAITGNNPSEIIDMRLPVHNVSWIEAVQFCNLLSEHDSLVPAYKISGELVEIVDTADGWRLPTEAEWEYLCRAGSESDFGGTGVLGEMGWYSDNSGLNPHAPGLRYENEFGLHDMHGNVWEWCWDYYSANYYSASPVENPKGPVIGEYRVLRGGSFAAGSNFARASSRYTTDELFDVGFRVVRNKK